MTIASGWHPSPFPEPADVNRTLYEALTAIAREHPERTAVIEGDRRISFEELIARVGGLAQQIVAADASAGPVGLLHAVGLNVIVAWFACGLAGRGLLLLEPHNPPDRNAELLASAGVTLLIRDGGGASGTYVECGVVTSIVPDGRHLSWPDGRGLTPEAPALIFPTSGSTGTPKLVTYSFAILMAKVQASIALMRIGPAETVIIAGSHGNFGFLHHALVFLLRGGAIRLVDVPRDGLSSLFAAIQQDSVGHVRFTPSLFRVAVAAPEAATSLGRLRGIRFSGEPLLWQDIALARRYLSPSCLIQNVYGSSESAIFIWTDDRDVPIGDGPAPIGRVYPFFEYRLHQRQEDGAHEGELIIRSRYQALGDWTGSAVDPVRFTPDISDAALCIYATGDIVRRDPNGSLVVIGRGDRLVKVNGYRVSLTEVEARLRSMPGCREAAIVERLGTRGTSLTAFHVGDDMSPASCSNWLAGQLPPPMIPARFVAIETLPLLPGGKVDYQSLTQLAIQAPLSGLDIRPDPGELPLDKLFRLWNDVLESPRGSDDPDANFFDLGGDSLRLLDLRLAIERNFACPIPDDSLLEQPTLRHLAELIGLDGLATPITIAHGIVTFRLFRAAVGPRRGVALTMPGWGGTPKVGPWTEAGLFPDHDIWSCRVTFPSGHILRRWRWIRVAEQIADAIAAGACPKPEILFGYSIAGYIAWLVDRLLVTRGLPAGHVICLDTVPMHHVPRRGNARLKRLVQRARHLEPNRLLIVRRAQPSSLSNPGIDRLCWNRFDGALTQAFVGVMDHADMESSEVLSAAGPAIAEFLECPPTAPSSAASDVFPVPIYSGRIFEFLDGRTAVSAKDVHNLVKSMPKYTAPDTLSALLILVLEYGDVEQLQTFVIRALKDHPIQTDFRYAHYLIGGQGVGRPVRRRSHTASRLGSMSAIEDAFARRKGMKTSNSLSDWLIRSIVRVRILTDHFIVTTVAKVRRRLPITIR